MKTRPVHRSCRQNVGCRVTAGSGTGYAVKLAFGKLFILLPWLHGSANQSFGGAYQTLDARLSRQFARTFELSLAGQNLFQPRHPEFGPVLIGRAGDAQIVWRRAAN
jgi:hypothetical protein